MKQKKFKIKSSTLFIYKTQKRVGYNDTTTATTTTNPTTTTMTTTSVV